MKASKTYVQTKKMVETTVEVPVYNLQLTEDEVSLIGMLLMYGVDWYSSDDEFGRAVRDFHATLTDATGAFPYKVGGGVYAGFRPRDRKDDTVALPKWKAL